MGTLAPALRRQELKRGDELKSARINDRLTSSSSSDGLIEDEMFEFAVQLSEKEKLALRSAFNEFKSVYETTINLRELS